MYYHIAKYSRKILPLIPIFVYLLFPPSVFAATLTRSNNTFFLDSKAISRFGLRGANALQNDTVSNRLINNLDSMKAHGIQSVSISLQGARANSSSYTNINAFNSDGSLNMTIMNRLGKVLDALNSRGMVGVVIFFYQAKDQTLSNDAAVLNAAKNATTYLKPWRNVWLNVINEPGHSGFDRNILKTTDGQKQIYSAIKAIDPSRITYVAGNASATDRNDGFSSGTGKTASNGNVVIEYSRQDSYTNPGVFTADQRSNAQSDATTTYNNKGYWFWHSAWHQKADTSEYPRYDKGGGGTGTGDRGVSFIWDKMKSLAGGGPVATNTPTPATTKPGDANGDGKVDGLDYVIWLTNYGKTVTGGASKGDFNTDGIVDGLDYVIWLNNYGSTAATPTPTSTATPTPTSSAGGGSIGMTKIGTGAYPAVAVDSQGNAHVVYASAGKLKYKKYTLATRAWGPEQDSGITQNASYRNDPDIVTDSLNRPHVLGGTSNGGGQYAYWNSTSWVKVGSFNRDTALAIDKNDNVFVVQRGSSTNFIRVFKRAPGSLTFTELPVPQVSAENDHVYTDIAVSLFDNSLHIVYRHGLPSSAKCSSISSTNSGSSWNGSGISGDDAEAPFVTASPGGKVYSVCGGGGAFEWTGSAWSSIGKAVTAGTRRLPVLSVDTSGNLYASAFAGIYNIRKGSSWIGEKTIASLSGKNIGFMRVAGAGSGAYIVWEEGENVIAENDNSAGNFDIVFAAIDSNGNVIK